MSCFSMIVYLVYLLLSFAKNLMSIEAYSSRYSIELLMRFYGDSERTSQLRVISGDVEICCSQGSSLDFAPL